MPSELSAFAISNPLADGGASVVFSIFDSTVLSPFRHTGRNALCFGRETSGSVRLVSPQHAYQQGSRSVLDSHKIFAACSISYYPLPDGTSYLSVELVEAVLGESWSGRTAVSAYCAFGPVLAPRIFFQARRNRTGHASS